MRDGAQRSLAWAAALAVLLVLAAPLFMLPGDLRGGGAEFAAALADRLIWARFGLTLLLVMAVLLVAWPMGLVLAWFLARTNLPARGALLALVPFAFFLPPLVHVLTWFSLFRLNGFPAIVLIHVLCSVPLIVLFSYDAFTCIARTQSEAIRTLGGARRAIADEFRQALPVSTGGAAIVAAFIMSDFAVADFLTSVGPKVTLVTDSIYLHYQGGRRAAALAASLPVVVTCASLFAVAVFLRRQSKSLLHGDHERAEPWRLGKWRWALLLPVAAPVLLGGVLPVLILAMETGSFGVLAEQTRRAGDSIAASARIGAIAAIIIVLAALALGMLARNRAKAETTLGFALLLPLAIPSLLIGVGLTRAWNRAGFDWFYLGDGVVVAALAARYLVFGWILVGGALSRLDDSLLESARLAGASPLKSLRGVVLPILLPTLLAGWCLAFGLTMRELDSFFMLRAGQSTLPFHLYSNVIFARSDEVAAIALLLVGLAYAPLLLHLAFFRRWIRWQ